MCCRYHVCVGVPVFVLVKARAKDMIFEEVHGK